MILWFEFSTEICFFLIIYNKPIKRWPNNTVYVKLTPDIFLVDTSLLEYLSKPFLFSLFENNVCLVVTIVV